MDVALPRWRIALLTLHRLLLAKLMRLHWGLLSKFSLWSLKEMNAAGNCWFHDVSNLKVIYWLSRVSSHVSSLSKKQLSVFEICLPSEHSPWMKQAVVVSFEALCHIVCGYLNIGHIIRPLCSCYIICKRELFHNFAFTHLLPKTCELNFQNFSSCFQTKDQHSR